MATPIVGMHLMVVNLAREKMSSENQLRALVQNPLPQATTLACEPGMESLRAESRDLESLEPRLPQKVINIIIFRFC